MGQGAIMATLYQAWFLFLPTSPLAPLIPLSGEGKDKAWKEIPLNGDWRARKRDDLSVGELPGSLYSRSSFSLNLLLLDLELGKNANVKMAS